MMNAFANAVLVGAVEKGTGVRPAGPVTAALLTTGATLLLTRGRRSVGLALVAAAGLLLWREEVRREEEAKAK